MAKQNKEPKTKNFLLSLFDARTHRHIWVMRFTRSSLFVTLVSIFFVLLAGVFCLVAFTPLKTFIPGYPDAHVQRTIQQNSLTIDSLEQVVTRWEFYTENLRRIVEGEDPVKIDSLIRNSPSDTVIKLASEEFHSRDSLLRQTVAAEEEFDLTGSQRALPIEGVHFFTPLKGVVSQGYDAVHPYIDITAPEGSVVMSVLDGTVIGASWSDESGYTISVQHQDDIISVYKHNQKLLRKSGDKVSAGTPIALMGNTGSLTTGDHLHFELWYKGEAVDPTKYISF